MLQESRAKSMVLQIKTKMDEIEERICPNPLMPRPGEKNPLGEYSPYLPPLQIPGKSHRHVCISNLNIRHFNLNLFRHSSCSSSHRRRSNTW